MAELAATRRPALDAPTLSRQGVRIEVLPSEARFSLRLPMNDVAAASEVAGFRLNMTINRYAANDKRWAARLGPNEWIAGGPDGEGETIANEIETALGGRIHALTDISHRQLAFAVEGPAAAAILNAGCPLDLSSKAFPPETATRTILGKVEITLIRPTDALSFRLECWRSFAEYVHAFLAEAARDCPGLP